MNGLKYFLILAALSALVSGSSCPCNEGVNGNLKTIETQMVYINRALSKLKPGSYSAFYKFLDNQKMRLIDQLNATSTGLPGSLLTSTIYRDVNLAQIQCTNQLQVAVANGTDDIVALTQFFNCTKKAFTKAYNAGKKATTGGYKQTTAAIEARNKVTLQYWMNQVKLLGSTADSLLVSPDEALKSYLQTVKLLTITLVQGARASCPGCLIPCCKASS